MNPRGGCSGSSEIATEFCKAGCRPHRVLGSGEATSALGDWIAFTSPYELVTCAREALSGSWEREPKENKNASSRYRPCYVAGRSTASIPDKHVICRVFNVAPGDWLYMRQAPGANYSKVELRSGGGAVSIPADGGKRSWS